MEIFTFNTYDIIMSEDFIKSLLSINDNLNAPKKDQKKINEFQSGIVKGFFETLPKEMRDQIKTKQKNFSNKELMKIYESIPEEIKPQVLEFIDFIVDNFSNSEPFHHNEYTLNPADLFNKYHEMKLKHKKYKESEDINNF